MPSDIQQFFNSYRESFNRLDGSRVSAHYQVPSMISNASSEGLFMDADAIMANNDALCNIYRDNGFIRADYTENISLEQGENFYLADLQWTIQWRDKPAQQFNTTYQLVRRGQKSDADERTWKIEHVTAYSEKRFWKDDAI
jgi:hypothetical protein